MAPREHPVKGPAPIPHTLSAHLCIDFVNSEFAEHRTGAQTYDRLAMPEWRRWFLERCGQTASRRLDSGMHAELVRARRLLRALLSARRQPTDTELATINRHLRAAPMHRHVQRRGDHLELGLSWRARGWRAALAEVITSYAGLAASGRMDRVRVCANPSCTYVFFDDSRGGRRRWCDPKLCGNLMHVRDHRARNQGVE